MWEPAAPANDHTHSRRNDYIAAWWRTTDVLYHNDHKERNNVLLRVAKRNARKRDTSPRTELQLTSSSSSRHCIQEMQSKRDSSHLLILHRHVRRRVRFEGRTRRCHCRSFRTAATYPPDPSRSARTPPPSSPSRRCKPYKIQHTRDGITGREAAV